MQQVEIVPSLLSADFTILAEEIKKIEKAGCNRIQLDVMDGKFVPYITFGPVVIQWMRKRTNLFLEVHLMIEHPERYLKSFKDAGADCIIVHQEACREVKNTIHDIHSMGIEAGIALKPKTSVHTIRDVVKDVALILIMTAEPGCGRQRMIAGIDKKIVETKNMLDTQGLDIPIEVEGGINTKTAPIVVHAGATFLVAGSSVFGKGDALAHIKALYKSIGVQK